MKKNSYLSYKQAYLVLLLLFILLLFIGGCKINATSKDDLSITDTNGMKDSVIENEDSELSGVVIEGYIRESTEGKDQRAAIGDDVKEPSVKKDVSHPLNEKENSKELSADKKNAEINVTDKSESYIDADITSSIGTDQEIERAPTSIHTHTYKKEITYISYPEEGEYQEVLIKAAYEEEIPVYEELERSICNGCGMDITGNIDAHLETQMLKGNTACSGYKSEVKSIQTGTQTINHPAEYDTIYVITKEAFVKEVIQYVCACGAIKEE